MNVLFVCLHEKENVKICVFWHKLGKKIEKYAETSNT